MAFRYVALIVALGVAAVPGGAGACPIPVFQFAIAYWEPDSYDVYIYHSGPLSAEHQAAAERLREASQHRETPANLRLHVVDATDANSLNIREAKTRGHLPAESMPWVVVHYPDVHGLHKPVWAGPLTPETPAVLTDSPMRRQIAKRLLEGKSSVVILLESGNRRQDNAAFDTLQAELARLEKVLVLPNPEGWGEDEPAEAPAGAGKGVSFDVLRLSRNNPAEALLVKMLTGSEEGLDEHKDQPIAFPIYGRGLVLYALAGAGINNWTITQAGEFLTGECSCQVKALNPGTDLLMTADWRPGENLLLAHVAPPMTGLSGFESRADQARRIVDEWSETDDSAHVVTVEIDLDRPSRFGATQPGDAPRGDSALPVAAGSAPGAEGGRAYLWRAVLMVAAVAVAVAVSSAVVYLRAARREGSR